MSKRIRVLNVLTFILSVVAVVLLVLVVNRQFALASLSKEINYERKKATEQKSKLAESKRLGEDYSGLTRKLGGRYANVNWSRHLPTMVNQLTGIMQSYKIKMETLRPNPIRSSGKVHQLPLRITFKAKLGDLAKLTRDIQQTNPKLNIESMNLKPSADDSGLLQVDMLISSYAIQDKDAPELVVAVSSKETPGTATVSKKSEATPKAGGER